MRGRKLMSHRGRKSHIKVCSRKYYSPGYTIWSEWDSCTVECGSGTKKRSRDHSDGTEEIEEIACNTAPCGKISGGEEYF